MSSSFDVESFPARTIFPELVSYSRNFIIKIRRIGLLIFNYPRK
jgi:hypothetical protein